MMWFDAPELLEVEVYQAPRNPADQSLSYGELTKNMKHLLPCGLHMVICGVILFGVLSFLPSAPLRTAG